MVKQKEKVMFENYIKNFIRVDKKFESIEQYNEFEKARVNINIKRSNYRESR